MYGSPVGRPSKLQWTNEYADTIISITSLIDVTSGEQTMVCRDRKILVTAHSKRGKYVPSWMTDDSMISRL